MGDVGSSVSVLPAAVLDQQVYIILQNKISGRSFMISRFYEQFSRKGSAMAPERLFEKISDLKYEHIIYHFKALGLEISNI